MQNKKSLNEMTFDELGRLFPVVLTEYNPEWPELFETEKEKIVGAAGADSILAVHHFGSTAIEGLTAKPTIDILLEIKHNADLDVLKNVLVNIGYEFTRNKGNPPPHLTFMKGYTLEGFKGQSYHIHVRFKGDWDELVFRDYLRENAQARHDYAELKKSLQKKYEFDREGYTQAKGGFIKSVVQKAREAIKK